MTPCSCHSRPTAAADGLQRRGARMHDMNMRALRISIRNVFFWGGGEGGGKENVDDEKQTEITPGPIVSAPNSRGFLVPV